MTRGVFEDLARPRRDKGHREVSPDGPKWAIPDAVRLAFGFWIPLQQLLHGSKRGDALIHDPTHCARYGHVDLEPVGQPGDGACGVDPFGNMSELGQNLLDRDASREFQPDPPVARKIARARQHEVADAREPHERFHLSAQP